MSQFPKFHDKLSESFLISSFFTLYSKACCGNNLCSVLPVAVSPRSKFLLPLDNRTCCVWRDHLSAECNIYNEDLIFKRRRSPLAASLSIEINSQIKKTSSYGQETSYWGIALDTPNCSAHSAI